jgi:glycosyltransferase involved in cell wall biosynthesis
MNVGMILNAPYPADIRVAKEAQSLIKAGHHVHLLCTNRGQQPTQEIVEGIRVHRIGGLSKHYQVGIWDVVNAVNFVHPLFYVALRRFIRQNHLDVLHVHDLPLAKTAISLGKRHGIPVVVDLHENFPEALSVWFAWKKNPLIRLKNRLFFGYKRWEKYERYAVHRADYVIAVVDEMKQRLVDKYVVDPDKITVVTNSEYKTFKDQEVIPNVYQADDERFTVTYTGNVGPHRGVDTVIEGMQYLKELPIRFAIVGRTNAAVQRKLEALIDEYELHKQVKLYGYQPFNTFFSFMSQADANIIPHHSNPHTDNTIPHKIFQCMQVKRPLVVSSSAPIRRIVEETSSGVVFEAGNPHDLAQVLRNLYEDQKLRKRLAQNGYLATQEGTYHWEHTEQALLALYRQLSNR